MSKTILEEMYLLSKTCLSNRILLTSKYKCLGSYYECRNKTTTTRLIAQNSGIIIDTWNYPLSQLRQHSRRISHSNSCLFHSIGQQYQKLDATKHEKSSSSSIVESKNRANDQISTHVSGVKRVTMKIKRFLTFTPMTKQAASDFSYTTIIAIGGVALIAMFYYLFSELFSRETPTGIYDESSKICSRNPEVIDALGQPIKVSAESGGRRVFQIKQKFFIEDGVLCLLINYYLEGPRNKADVIVKVKKNATSEKFEYDYIVVKLDHPHRGQYKINVKPEL